jgi:hypothetical protein
LRCRGAVFLSRKRQAKIAALAIREANAAIRPTGEHGSAARIIARPKPEGSFQPISFGGKIGHGVRDASQAVRPSIFGQRIVVNCPQSGKLSQQVRREPAKRLRLTDLAERQFQRPGPPFAFQFVSGLSQSQTELAGGRPSPHDARPKLHQQRIRDKRL